MGPPSTLCASLFLTGVVRYGEVDKIVRQALWLYSVHVRSNEAQRRCHYDISTSTKAQIEVEGTYGMRLGEQSPAEL